MTPRQEPAGPGEITELLHAAAQGDVEVFGRLVSLVYAELNAMARSRLRSERAGHTLSTTALVHEAYLKLVDQTRAEWMNREQFFAVASEAMRRILVDHARRRGRAKRGNGEEHVSFDELADTPIAFASDTDADELIALDEALERLVKFNPDGARVVQLRFFGGLSNDQVAEILNVSERSVRRSWTAARAWLRRELGRGPAETPLLILAAASEDAE